MTEIEARYYTRHLNNSVQCNLCPHQCIIQDGHKGICRVRVNNSGRLLATTYGNLSALNLDPIEKKPLYHFYPGKQILSLGSVGCNMRCSCCQNYSISQVGVYEMPRMIHEKNNDLIKLAKNYTNNVGLAFTYNEPSVWYEYMFDLAKSAKENGLVCALVSNGFINKDPLNELLNYVDAFNIDVKASSENVYKSFTGASFDQVKNNLKIIRERNKVLELTYLLVPGVNDEEEDFSDLITWIKEELGDETVLHISRYFPTYKMDTSSTPLALLESFTQIAHESLKYVYQGNVSGHKHSDTICPHCGTLLVERLGYLTRIANLNSNGKCQICNESIPIII